MKKKMLALLISVFILVGVFALVGCNDGPKATSITNLKYNGETITWSSVKNAKSYKIKINGGKEIAVQQATGEVVSFQHDALGVDFDFEVTAIIKEDSDKNPNYKIKFKNLGQVSGLVLVNGELTWTDIAAADGYELVANNVLYGEIISVNKFADTSAGEFNYKVRAVKNNVESADGNNGYFSEWSDKLQGEILSAPTNIKYDSEKFTWDANAKASGYKIKIGNEEFSATKAEFVHAAGNKDFDISVKAIGIEESNTYDSKYSEKKSYTYLAPVSNLNVQEGVLRWDKVENALKYKIKIDGNVLNTEVIKNEYSAFDAGKSYRIQIMPIGTGDFYFSNWSNEMTITLLVAPILGFSDSNITWNQVPNAEGYYLKIVKDGEVVYSKEMGKDTFTHVYGFEEAGIYDVQIKSTTIAGRGYESKYSQILAVERLAAPKNARISNQPLERENVMISFDDVANANGFTVVANGLNIRELERNSFELGLATETFEKVVNIKITSKGILKLAEKKVVLDSLDALEVTVTKLAVPQNVKINGNEISWGAVNNTNGYIIDVDSNRYEVTGLNYALSIAAGNHTIRVRARGNGNAVVSSDYSTTLAIMKLAKPINLRIEGRNLKWDVVPNATSYKVLVGTEQFTANTNNYPLMDHLSNISEGQGIQLSVFAIGNGGIKIDSDVSSEKQTISKLARPDNIGTDDSNIIWNPTKFNGVNINKYKLFIDGNEEGIVVSGTSFPVKDLSAGEHTVCVMALGDDKNHIDSPKTTLHTFTKLAQVSVTRNGANYEWGKVDMAIKYEIKINDIAISGFVTTTYYAPGFTTGGMKKVDIRAIGDGGATSTASEWTTIMQEVEALDTPTFTFVVEGNIVTITASEDINAQKYIFNIGTEVDNGKSNVFTFTDNDGIGQITVTVKVVGGIFVGDKYMIDSNLSKEQTINFE